MKKLASLFSMSMIVGTALGAGSAFASGGNAVNVVSNSTSNGYNVLQQVLPSGSVTQTWHTVTTGNGTVLQIDPPEVGGY